MTQNLDVDLKIYERCLLQGSFLWENTAWRLTSTSGLAAIFLQILSAERVQTNVFQCFLQLLYGIPSHAEGPKKLTYQLSQIHTLETQRSPRTVLISLKC